MNTEEIALKLVELCRKGEWLQAVDDLYGKDIVSVEGATTGSMPSEMRGLDQVRAKSHWWIHNHEVHSSKVGKPFVAGDRFVVQFDVDVTEKASKTRSQVSEVGIYTVANGKISHEEFLPLAGGKH